MSQPGAELGTDGASISSPVDVAAAPAGPLGTQPGIETRIYIKLKQLSDRINNEEAVSEWLIKMIGEGNGAIVINDDFKEKLAELMGIDEDKITDAALNAIFGDQSADGELDENDKLTVDEFEERLDEAVDFFAARGEQGFQMFLRKEEIYILSVQTIRQSFSDNNVLAAVLSSPAAFSTFITYLKEQAGPAWVRLSRDEMAGQGEEAIAEEESRRNDELQELIAGLDRYQQGLQAELPPIPRELEDQIFYVYLTRFETRCSTAQPDPIRFDDDINWESVAGEFATGLLLDFILGDFPPSDGVEEITEELIRSAAEENKELIEGYRSQLPSAAPSEPLPSAAPSAQ